MEEIETPAGSVSAVFDGPEDASVLLVLAHGAGAPLDSDFMREIARRTADDGVRVCRFNFVYMEQGRKAPDRAPVLEETFRSVLEAVRGSHTTVLAGGKSMGGRIASMIAAAGADVDGVVLLGYPLHPPGRPDRIRKAHLSDVTVPMLFVEGTRDPFCPLDTLDEVLKEVAVRADVVVIDDGDHSFKVRKSSGRSTQDAWAEAAAAVTSWIDKNFE